MASDEIRTELRINGRTVYRMRRLQKLTQAQVATRAGADDKGKPFIDHTTVSHVEAGRQPSEVIMGHIANGLGVHLSEITYLSAVYSAAEPAA